MGHFCWGEMIYLFVTTLADCNINLNHDAKGVRRLGAEPPIRNPNQSKTV